MAIVLYHHPFSRAAGVLWTLEEVGVPYTLRFTDIIAGAQKQPELLSLNPMGKLPTLVDGDTVVTEAAAIALYLADRYAPGRLAPAGDDPRRGTYLRWSFFAPSVIEPAVMSKLGGWEYRESSAGWGSYAAMLDAMKTAVADGFFLGDTFSMADVVFGGTVRFMRMVGTLPPEPVIDAYIERLNARPALQRADAKNAAIVAERGLKLP
jgi:glutathione S-transferase